MHAKPDEETGAIAVEERFASRRKHLRITEFAALLDALPEAAREALDHLLDCDRCRRLLAEGEDSAVAPEELTVSSGAAEEPRSGAALQHAIELGEELRRRLEEDRSAAPALFEELMAAPEEERHALASSEPRFASPGLARLLLTAAAQAVRNPSGSAQARLALAVASHLDRARYGDATARAFDVEAHALLAEALWHAEEHAAAWETLAAGAREAEAAPIDGCERARWCRAAALLYHGDGKADEALALLTRAGELYRLHGEPGELAATLVEKGSILADFDAEAALETLACAVELVKPAADSLTVLRLWEAMALCEAEFGHRRTAETLVARCRELAAERDVVDQVEFAWTEARVAEHLGEGKRATELLLLIAAGLSGLRRPFAAAFAALDWAELVLLAPRRPGELERLRHLGGQIAKKLPRTAGLVLNVALRVAGRNDVLPPYLFAHVRDYLKRARRRPDLAYTSSRGGMGVAGWDLLPQAERRAICREAGAGEHVATLAAGQIGPDLRDLLSLTHQELTGIYLLWEPAREGREPEGRGGDGGSTAGTEGAERPGGS